MALYTGNYLDVGLDSLAPFSPTITATLSRESFSKVGNRLLSRRPVEATLGSGGFFTLDLVPNDEILGNTYYELQATYLDAGSNFTRIDLFKIYARTGGGEITDMFEPGYVFKPAYVFWQDNEPDPWPVGWIWVNKTSGDVNRRTA
jgi:hypothetical protein